MAAFSDWPGRGGGQWLPAYGFTNHLTHQNHGFIEDDDDEESIVVAESACFAEPLLESAGSHDISNLANAVGGGSGNFLFVLETIVEETSDQLNGDASPKRPASPASSGEQGRKDIPVPSFCLFDDDNGCDPEMDCTRSGSRSSDGEVPKKRRRKDPSFLDTPLISGDLSDEDDLGSISRSSSLLQFESLERQLESESVGPFRTTASSDPFGPPQSPISSPISSPSPSSSSCSSDYEEEDNSGNSSSDTLTGDSFPPVAAAPFSSSSSSSSPPSSESPSAGRPRVNRLRSYRSFDSLNLVAGRGDDNDGQQPFSGWKGGFNPGNRSLRHVSDRHVYSGRSLNAFRTEADTQENGFRVPEFGFRDVGDRYGSWSEKGNDFFFQEFGVPEDSGGEMTCQDVGYSEDFWGEDTLTEKSDNDDNGREVVKKESTDIAKSTVDGDSGFASSESPKSSRDGNGGSSPKDGQMGEESILRKDGDGEASFLDAESNGDWCGGKKKIGRALREYSGEQVSEEHSSSKQGIVDEKAAFEKRERGMVTSDAEAVEATVLHAHVVAKEGVKEVEEGDGGTSKKRVSEDGDIASLKENGGTSEGMGRRVVEEEGLQGGSDDGTTEDPGEGKQRILNGRVPEAEVGSLIASERAQVVDPRFAIGDVTDEGYHNHVNAGDCFGGRGVGAAWADGGLGGRRHARPRGGSFADEKGRETGSGREGGERGNRRLVKQEAVCEETGVGIAAVVRADWRHEKEQQQNGSAESSGEKEAPTKSNSGRSSPGHGVVTGSSGSSEEEDRVVEGEATLEDKKKREVEESLKRVVVGVNGAPPNSLTDGEEDLQKGRGGAEGSSDGEEVPRKVLPPVRGSADGEEDHGKDGGAAEIGEEVSARGKECSEDLEGREAASGVGGVFGRGGEGRTGDGVEWKKGREESKTEIVVGRERKEANSASGHRAVGVGGSLGGEEPLGGAEGKNCWEGRKEGEGDERRPRLHIYGGAGRHSGEEHSSSVGRLDAGEAAEIRRRRKFGNAASDYWRGESAVVERFYNGRSRSEGGLGGKGGSGRGRSASDGEEYEEEEEGIEGGWCIPEGNGSSGKGRSVSWAESSPSVAEGGGWRLALKGILRRRSSGDKGQRGASNKGKNHHSKGKGIEGKSSGVNMKSEGKPPLPPKGGALSFLTRLSFRRRKAPRVGSGGQQVGGVAWAQAHPGIDRELPDGKDAYAALGGSREADGAGGVGREEEGCCRSGRSDGGRRQAPAASNGGGGGRSTSLMDLGEDVGSRGVGGKKDATSCNVAASNVASNVHQQPQQGVGGVGVGVVDSRAKSMEFLLDEGNKAAVLPPENELQKVGVGAMGVGGVGAPLHLSEHQLRVQRSLQKLNVPEWYLRSTAGGSHRTHPESGASSPLSFLERRHSSGRRPGGGWPGLASKTTSLSSLQTRRSPTPTRCAASGNAGAPSTPSSRRLLSPAGLSSGGPSPDEPGSYSSFGSVTPRASFSRWSTSRLHQRTTLSLAPSAPTSPRSSFSTPRAPYLGWRSQERLLLSDPSHYRTPSERLAADLLATRRAAAAAAAAKPASQQVETITPTSASVRPPSVEVYPPPGKTPELSEVRSSITEVTSAIVHYVSERVPEQAGGERRSPVSVGRPCSPRQLCWVESSFVGSRPIDSPQTPPDLVDGSRRCSSVLSSGETGRGFSGEAAMASCTPNGPIKEPIESSIMPSGALLEAAARRAAVRLELESYRHAHPPNPDATLEDVLDSLLGLPPASSSRSPASPASPVSPLKHPPHLKMAAVPVLPPALHSAVAPQPVIAPKMVIAPHPVIAPQPAIAPQPVLAPQPAIAPKPVIAPQPTIAPKPVMAPQSYIAPKPVTATKPVTAPQQFNVPQPAVIVAEPRQVLPQEPPPATPPPLPEKPPPVIRTTTGEPRRRNPSHQRRARNQSRAISPTTPSPLHHLQWSSAAPPEEIVKVQSVPTPPPEVENTAAVDDMVASARREDEDEEQAASPSEEDEDAAGGFPPPPPFEDRNNPLEEAASLDADHHLPPYTANDGDPMLRPKDDDAPRRRVSFEIRQLSDDSEADARRRRHCARKRSRAAASCRRVAAAATAPSSPALPVLSRVARQGFLARGRGCVKVFFPGPERAEAFAAAAVSAALAGVRSPVGGEPASAAATALSELGEPVYAGWADLPLPTGGCGEKCYRDLVQLCRTYDPDLKLVLLVCVCVSSAETPGAGKWSRKVVSRCMSAKLGPFRLAPEPQYHHPRPSDPPPPPPPRRHHPLPASLVAREGVGEDFRPRSPITREMEYPETLVLRGLPIEGCGVAKREDAYGNIQKHLKRRGVSLRKQFPDIHRRLRSYVEDGDVFVPAAIHPRDGLTGRPFLCVILPEGADEPCWEGEEGGRLKRVDVGTTDEEDEEDDDASGGRGSIGGAHDGRYPSRQLDTP